MDIYDSRKILVKSAHGVYDDITNFLSSLLSVYQTIEFMKRDCYGKRIYKSAKEKLKITFLVYL